jgi:very-short-patch-repair endonuclease
MPRGKRLVRKQDVRVPLARQLRRRMTAAERKLWWHLREARFAGTHFRRQATIGRYFVDFCCHTARLIVEVDGDDHAQHRKRSDLRRTAFLNARGYRVVRFWNDEVLTNIEGVMMVIHDVLVPDDSAAPHP